jgi:hypothetical protein
MANINSVDIMALKKGEVNLGVSRCSSLSLNLDILAWNYPTFRGGRTMELDMLSWTGLGDDGADNRHPSWLFSLKEGWSLELIVGRRRGVIS